MSLNKIVPCLWFHTEGGNVSAVTNYYKSIFAKDFKQDEIVTLGQTPSGNTEMCKVFIYDQKYIFMSTANPHHVFNEALAFALNCEDQN